MIIVYYEYPPPCLGHVMRVLMQLPSLWVMEDLLGPGKFPIASGCVLLRDSAEATIHCKNTAFLHGQGVREPSPRDLYTDPQTDSQPTSQLTSQLTSSRPRVDRCQAILGDFLAPLGAKWPKCDFDDPYMVLGTFCSPRGARMAPLRCLCDSWAPPWGTLDLHSTSGRSVSSYFGWLFGPSGRQMAEV